jgi:hypothetical protein
VLLFVFRAAQFQEASEPERRFPVINRTRRRRDMPPTIAECLEHARYCEWYAARTNDQEDGKFLLQSARDWTKLAAKKELDIWWAAAKDAA